MRDVIHLSQNRKYGHVSQIVHPVDVSKYPLFTQAKPMHFELKAGECIYIPGGWWHWIVSGGDRCASVNYWFENSTLGTMPVTKPFDMTVPWTDEYLARIIGDETVAVWDTHADVMHFLTFDTFRRDARAKKYYISTVKGYDPGYKNKFIIDALRPDTERIRVNVGAPEDSVTNFWFNYGNVDTRLHYDDYSSIVCVLDGTKVIDLYPPEQSEFLYPCRKPSQ